MLNNQIKWLTEELQAKSEALNKTRQGLSDESSSLKLKLSQEQDERRDLASRVEDLLKSKESLEEKNQQMLKKLQEVLVVLVCVLVVLVCVLVVLVCVLVVLVSVLPRPFQLSGPLSLINWFTMIFISCFAEPAISICR